MNEERIMTLHPRGKKGVNILKRRYDIISNFIIKILSEKEEITFQEIADLAVKKLTPTFDGKVIWYLVSVKLDLEARNIIKRIPKTSPHKLKLVS